MIKLKENSHYGGDLISTSFWMTIGIVCAVLWFIFLVLNDSIESFQKGFFFELLFSWVLFGKIFQMHVYDLLGLASVILVSFYLSSKYMTKENAFIKSISNRFLRTTINTLFLSFCIMILYCIMYFLFS